MKCINCGCELKEGKNNCPECGAFQVDLTPAEKKEDGVSLSTAIASVLIIVFVTCAVIGFYFAYGRDKINETNIRRQLQSVSGGNLIAMYYEDFNGDGSKEAFGVTGSGSSNSVINGNLWYIRDKKGLNIKSGFSGRINGTIMEREKKYISIDIYDGNGDSLSNIWGVNKYGECYQPESSGKYKNVRQENGRILTDEGAEIKIDVQ